MRIEHPACHHLPDLRRLWQEIFGDTDAFLDSFYQRAFAPDRCRCILIKEQIAAVLYWLDCQLDGRPMAYIYAVATHPQHRGKGLCRMLMEDTHQLLTERGYSGALLVPQQEGLRKMYAKMGYRNAGGLQEFSCTAGAAPIPLRAVGPLEFAALRRRFLPAHSVLQEGHSLDFLADQLQFYAGDEILLAAFAENGMLHGMELLGSPETAPGILTALGCTEGTFRLPGSEKPFAMFHPLAGDAPVPEYFGFAFD